MLREISSILLILFMTNTLHDMFSFQLSGGLVNWTKEMDVIWYGCKAWLN